MTTFPYSQFSHPKAEIGDYLTFKAATRSHYKIAVRRVREIDHLSRPCVAYHGYRDFAVRWEEVLSISAHKPEAVSQARELDELHAKVTA
jgi:hypothetical protein